MKRYFSIVKSDHLANRLRMSNRSNLLIIDVREPENFVSGHIKGAWNYDSRDISRWKEIDTGLLEKINSSNFIFELYFHCHMSLIRGPSSAKHIEDLLARDSFLKENVKVFLVEGGWKGWKRQYPDLTYYNIK